MRVVQHKEAPGEIPDFKVSLGLNVKMEYTHKNASGKILPSSSTLNIPQIMVDAQLAKSKREASRLIQQGGVELDGVKVEAPNCEVKNGAVLKVGKRRFVRLVTG